MLRIALFCLSSGVQNSEKEYFSLKDDIYDFIIAHWHLLCGSKSYKGRSWHKQVRKHSLFWCRRGKVKNSGLRKISRVVIMMLGQIICHPVSASWSDIKTHSVSLSRVLRSKTRS